MLKMALQITLPQKIYSPSEVIYLEMTSDDGDIHYVKDYNVKV